MSAWKVLESGMMNNGARKRKCKAGSEVLRIAVAPQPKKKEYAKAQRARRKTRRIFSSSRLPSKVSRDFLFCSQDYLAAKKRKSHKSRKNEELWQVRQWCATRDFHFVAFAFFRGNEMDWVAAKGCTERSSRLRVLFCFGCGVAALSALCAFAYSAESSE